ncbi:hypothetical protein CK203_094918 [Vitis vinifera]|uniref:Uncharacterized protein n=1 Tax=Vitis vinifera TaxID=29760 RepID=A0A438DNA3_VITVI|nr:hypothetical protein CK203_094918 [Vitis vinifera]
MGKFKVSSSPTSCAFAQSGPNYEEDNCSAKERGSLLLGTPQQNGITERKNRHLLEVARALREEKILQEDQFSILPLPIWNHVTEYGDVEEIDNIQPAAGKETDIIKPAVVEIVDSGLMVYSRRLRLMQEQDPTLLHTANHQLQN